jgi:hypothetical protein
MAKSGFRKENNCRERNMTSLSGSVKAQMKKLRYIIIHAGIIKRKDAIHGVIFAVIYLYYLILWVGIIMSVMVTMVGSACQGGELNRLRWSMERVRMRDVIQAGTITHDKKMGFLVARSQIGVFS